MHSLSALSSSNRAACTAAYVCATFLLMLCSYVSQSNISDPAEYDASMDSLYNSPHDPARFREFHRRSSDAPHHQFLRILTDSTHTSLHRSMKLSTSDLQSRHALEQSFQIAAFQQYDDQNTAQLYTVSVSTTPSATVQAIRLRAGSLRRYGVTINEFIIPRGCQVNPVTERVLFVYSRMSDGTLFGNLPDGYVLASPVLSLLAYDALNLGISQPAQQLTLSATGSPIIIQFAASSDVKCAFFDDDSTAVTYTDVVAGACLINGTGWFALVGNASAPAPSPSLSPSPSPSSSPSPSPTPSPTPSPSPSPSLSPSPSPTPSPSLSPSPSPTPSPSPSQSPSPSPSQFSSSSPSLSPFLAPITAALPPVRRSHSNTRKIVVGSVVGGLVLLFLLSLLALYIAKHRKNANLAKMEHQADNGEALQTDNIGNSRVPAAGSTRTPSMIEREYAV